MCYWLCITYTFITVSFCKLYYIYLFALLDVGLQSLKEVYIDHSSNKRIKTVESVSHEDLPKDNGNSNERKDNTIDNTFEIKDSVPVSQSINQSIK